MLSPLDWPLTLGNAGVDLYGVPDPLPRRPDERGGHRAERDGLWDAGQSTGEDRTGQSRRLGPLWGKVRSSSLWRPWAAHSFSSRFWLFFLGHRFQCNFSWLPFIYLPYPYNNSYGNIYSMSGTVNLCQFLQLISIDLIVEKPWKC